MTQDVISRRSFLLRTGLAGSLAGSFAATSCGRKLASRYAGFLYVARKGQRSVAVIDLEQFRWAGKIDLPSPPVQLIKAGSQLLAVCPESGSVHAIDLQAQKASPPIRLPAAPSALLPAGDGSRAFAVGTAGEVFRLDLQNHKVTARGHVGAPPAGFDNHPGTVAIAVPSRRSVVLLDDDTLKEKATMLLGVEPSIVRFRMDGKSLLAGAWRERQIVTMDPAAATVLTRLPLPISPERFCFNGDGGQMFVSGSGADVVTIVSPYQNEVDQTILAGRTPGEMLAIDGAGQQSLLLVANPGSGDLTIIDIYTRMLSASVHVGEQPGQVLVTPNNEFALVLNRQSGNVAVIRMKTVLDHKNKTKPLFTVVPVGAEPVSAVIMPHETV